MGSCLDLDPCFRTPTGSSLKGFHADYGSPRQLAWHSSIKWCPSSFSAPRQWMTNGMMHGSLHGDCKYPKGHLGQQGLGPTYPSVHVLISFIYAWVDSLKVVLNSRQQRCYMKVTQRKSHVCGPFYDFICVWLDDCDILDIPCGVSSNDGHTLLASRKVCT
jgi:hypothetical protein